MTVYKIINYFKFYFDTRHQQPLKFFDIYGKLQM